MKKKLQWLTQRNFVKKRLSRPHSSFWKLFCWGRLHRHQWLLGCSSAGEGCTDTNAYWDALLLRKAAQTPMLIGKLFFWGRLHRHQCLLGSSSAGEGYTDTSAYWDALLLGKVAQTLVLTGMLFCWGRLHRH